MADPATPRASVCMATYNGEAFVADQVRSILEQLGPDDEVVIVDDASRDATLEVLRCFDDPRVHITARAQNRGYVRTFEEALTRARGEFLLLADQDDVWLPGRLEAMIDALAVADVVATNLATLGGPEAIRGPFGQRDWRLRASTSTHRVRNVLGILAGNRPYYGCAMGVRRSALRRLLPFPSFLTESHDLWIALYGNTLGRLTHLELRSLARRYHETNQTPNAPRGVAAALRSRAVLVRCLAELATRRRG